MNKFKSQFPTRRQFLRDVSVGGASLITLSLLGGCESLLEAINNRPMRRRITNASAANQQVDIYRNAVSLMKALPTSDARNWTNQASIHNNHCPHGNWFFFPWHRAYLFHFEKICQKLTGEAGFGLPYWNWCLDGSIPSGYWEPPAGNALYDSTRVATASSVADPGSVGLPLVDGFCNEPNFTLFAGGSATELRPMSGGSAGNIEATPHNYIHAGFVRGDMGNFMSPLDPIFWNHHCMVDLCWYEWNVNRKHANPNDPTWTNFVFTGMFCDPDGNPAPDMQLIDTILMPLLSYQYDSGIGGAMMMNVRRNRDFKKISAIIKQGASAELEVKQRFALAENMPQITVENPRSEAIAIKAAAFTTVFGANPEDRVILRIKELEQPPRNDVFLRVFINKPDADANTLRDDPHYAGSFYFFVHNQPGMAMPHDWLVDITPTLNRLFPSGTIGSAENITVNLVAVPINGSVANDISLHVAGLELIISPVNLKLMAF
jgi:tyrosinase